VGVDSNVVFDEKCPGEKGSVRWCVVVMKQPVLSSLKFGANCHALLKNVSLVCRMNCLACQDEFHVNNPLDVKENNEHDFAFRQPHLFCSR
jgi:hypothetical protein